MQLKDLARRLPDDIWNIFEPILPARVWFGNGRPPCGNRECLHALLYVLASGISWEFLPWCFPSYKPLQRRLKDWLREDAFSGGGSNWPSGTSACTGSTGTKFSSTAPRGRRKRG